jgi:5-methylcytosine-specific restriction endonuclease McrA
MGMIEIIADFIKQGGRATNPRATHLCLVIIVKIYFARNRNNFSPANTYLVQKRKGWTTTTSSTIRKAPKITRLEHRKRNTPNLCTPLQTLADKGDKVIETTD